MQIEQSKITRGTYSYSQKQLRFAVFKVCKESDYKEPSAPIYEDERPDHYPSVSAIESNCESFTAVRDAAVKKIESEVSVDE